MNYRDKCRLLIVRKTNAVVRVYGMTEELNLFLAGRYEERRVSMNGSIVITIPKTTLKKDGIKLNPGNIFYWSKSRAKFVSNAPFSVDVSMWSS